MRFIYGHSLGAAVALDLAAGERDAAGVIAEAGFTSLPDMVADRNLPVGALLTQRFDALDRARSLSMPSLFIHGTADSVVPSTMSERAVRGGPRAQAPADDRRRQPQQLRNGTGMSEVRRAVDEFVGSSRSSTRRAAPPRCRCADAREGRGADSQRRMKCSR